jgi:Putative MetA-pathway of phenol degradation
VFKLLRRANGRRVEGRFPLRWRRLCLSLLLIPLGVRLFAQDLEPRVYAASPVGTTFVGMGFGRTTGDVTFDPTIPVTNVTARFNAPTFSLSHTFALAHRQTLFTAALPYVWGNLTGEVETVSGTLYRSGLSDLRLRYSVNLHGSPAMSVKEFMRHPKTYILAASVIVQPPTGQYEAAKLINLGTNRWSFKPEVGFSYPVKKVDLDLYAGAWFFTANNSFYPGTSNRVEQPLTALQAHVSYTIRRGLWAAFDSTWYGGGNVSINHSPWKDRQNNTKLGGTISVPLPGRQSVKFAYNTGIQGSIGATVNAWSVGWQKTFLK